MFLVARTQPTEQSKIPENRRNTTAMQTITKKRNCRGLPHRLRFRLPLLMLLLYVACYPPELKNEPVRTPAPAPGAGNPVLARLAFGSCNDYYADQPLWETLHAAEPDAFLWTGDIVYADVWVWPGVAGQAWLRIPTGQVRDEQSLRAAYALQKQHPGYRSFTATLSAGVLGIYDDHDYGKNNGGREFPLRGAARRALLDFLDVPDNAPRRIRQGTYEAYDFPLAARPGRFVRIILLDTRYHRDARPKSDEAAATADILGEAQWTWLEDQLQNSRAAVHVIVSSVQVVAEEHRYEKWANFPAARKRLYHLLDRHRPRAVVLISGDRHLAEISRTQTPGGLEIVDVTSSGMTHSVPVGWSEENRHRVGELFAGLNFGVLEFTEAAVVARIRDRENATVLETRVQY